MSEPALPKNLYQKIYNMLQSCSIIISIYPQREQMPNKA